MTPADDMDVTESYHFLLVWLMSWAVLLASACVWWALLPPAWALSVTLLAYLGFSLAMQNIAVHSAVTAHSRAMQIHSTYVVMTHVNFVQSVPAETGAALMDKAFNGVDDWHREAAQRMHISDPSFFGSMIFSLVFGLVWLALSAFVGLYFSEDARGWLTAAEQWVIGLR